MNKVVYSISGEDNLGVEQEVFKAGFNSSNNPSVTIGELEVDLANTQVEPNPTLSGDESLLQSLKIGLQKFKLGGGTQVDPNPALEGTEPDLTSIKIGSDKFKIASTDPAVESAKEIYGMAYVIPGENEELVTWDGSTEGKESWEFSQGTGYLIEDTFCAVTGKDFIGATLIVTDGTNDTTVTVTEDQVIDVFEVGLCAILLPDNFWPIISVTSPMTVPGGTSIVSPGLYFLKFTDNPNKFVKSLTFTPSYLSKISSNNIASGEMTPEGNVLTADGNGNAIWAAPQGGEDPVLENAKETGGIGWLETLDKTVTWDGEIGSKESIVSGNCTYVKVSEDYNITKSQLLGKTYTRKNIHDQQTSTITCTDENVYDTLIDTGIVVYDGDAPEIFITSAPVTLHEVFEIPSSGTWVLKFVTSSNAGFYIQNYSYTGVETHKIVSKYLTEDSVLANAKETNGIGHTEVRKAFQWDGEDSDEAVPLEDGSIAYRVAEAPVLDPTCTEASIEATIIQEDTLVEIADHPGNFQCCKLGDPYGVIIINQPYEPFNKVGIYFFYTTFTGVKMFVSKFKINEAEASVSWNGDLTNKEYIGTESEGYCRVVTMDTGIEEACEVTSNVITISDTDSIICNDSYYKISYQTLSVYGIYKDNTTILDDAALFEKAGLYYKAIEIENVYCYASNVTAKFISQIDTKYLTVNPVLKNSINTLGIGHTDYSEHNITWDGVVGDKEHHTFMESGNNIAVFMTSSIPENFDNIKDLEINYSEGGVAKQDWVKSDAQLAPSLYYIREQNGKAVLLVATQTCTYNNEQYTKGLYFCKSSDGQFYTTQFTATLLDEVCKISSKYLNDTTTVENAKKTGGIGWGGPIVISWDGDPTGRQVVTIGDVNLYKISDDVITDSSILVGGKALIHTGSTTTQEVTITSDELVDLAPGAFIVGEAAVFASKPCTIYGVTLPVGTWFFSLGQDTFWVEKITYGESEIHKINPSYISSGTEASGKVLAADGSGGVTWTTGGGSSQFVVTLTEDNNYSWTADKTYEQLVAALSETQNIVALAKHSNIIDNVLQLVTCKEDEVVSDTYKFVFKVTTKEGDPIITAECSETGWEVWRGKWKPYLTFESDAAFSLQIRPASTTAGNAIPWDGKLYYSTDKTNWVELTLEMLGNNLTSGSDNKLYFRGLNNSYIASPNETKAQYNVGYITISQNTASIRCLGNIENLLDWKDVQDGIHPVMANGCFATLFNCSYSTLYPGLSVAPELPATTLSEKCYYRMFASTKLIEAPELPATTLAVSCYEGMFDYCKDLLFAHDLKAQVLPESCYRVMFQECSSLKVAPQIEAIEVSENCCNSMFCNCYELVTPPSYLKATVLAESCYNSMFDHCAKLLTAPVLYATQLAESCYSSMFSSCLSLTSAAEMFYSNTASVYHTPDISYASCCAFMYSKCRSLINAPATIGTSNSAGQSACERMFYGCKELRRAPYLPAKTLGDYAYESMFEGCFKLEEISTLPATTLGNRCYDSMFKNCYSLPVYTSSAEGHQQSFKIPTSGTATGTTDTTDMFLNTIGSLTAGGSYQISGQTLYTKIPAVTYYEIR